mgnify:CR=1 FL=1
MGFEPTAEFNPSTHLAGEPNRPLWHLPEVEDFTINNPAEGVGSKPTNWKLLGAYLRERAWGTAREDYSEKGAAWEYFPHDHARSRVCLGDLAGV